MSLLNKNKNYLKKMRAFFLTENKNHFDCQEDASYQKKDGIYLAKRKNVRCFLHSKYSPLHEVETMFASTPQSAKHIVLFGCGAGGAVRYALNKDNFPLLENLTIVEPSPAWAEIVMNETDMEKTWGENAGLVSFIVGHNPDIVGREIGEIILRSAREFSPVYHLSVRTLFREYYQELLNSITEHLRNVSLLINSNKIIIHKKIYNEILNLIRPSYEFSNMMDFFNDKNIIIVSAGTSLEKNIHLLPEAKKKAVVVAVGSAIRILDAKGITPHFRMGLDPFPEQYKIYNNLSDESVPLAYNSSIYPEVLSGYKGDLLRFQTDLQCLDAFFYDECKKIKKIVNAGPSVANVAVEFFCAAGCRSIVFIGQDMCMYDYRLHANTDTNEHLRKDDSSKSLLFLKDINGNDVTSPRNYYVIKQALETSVAHFKDKVEFINATEGGLGIQGVPNLSFASVLANWKEYDVALLIAEQLKTMELIDFKDNVREIEKTIVKIDALNDENLRNLQKVKDVFINDTTLTQREKYVQAFKKAKNNEQLLKKINFYTNIIHSCLDSYLTAECMSLQANIDSSDEKLKFRSILEIQLKTAQATKSLTLVLKLALKDAFADEVKIKTFSLAVK